MAKTIGQLEIEIKQDGCAAALEELIERAKDQELKNICPTCSAPMLPETKTLVLYFRNHADRQEVIDAVSAAYPNMISYKVDVL